MDFLFEVKFKNGQVQEIRIHAKVAADAIKELKRMYDDIASYKLLS